MNQDRTPLLEAVTEFINTKPAYFRIPGHRMERGISTRWTSQVGKSIFAYDVTETPKTDDLHNPEGAIQDAQELLQELYGADRSFFLVNGSTCGNEAMIVSAALAGEKIMVARNAHKSAMMGLVISGATPVYVMPERIDAWGIQGAITPEAVRKCFTENPDCKALFLVSPTYYGVCSDLAKIAEICHAYGALLLVDEAHGAHVYFHDELPMGALQAGADMCVQSMHKVTGALTQSAVLHIKSHGVCEEALERVAENLHLVQSTSPNYLLMISLDCARYELAQRGTQMMEKALLLAQQAREKINSIPGFTCMEKQGLASKMTGVSDLDKTRIVISAKELGLTGFALDQILYEKYSVNMELSDYGNVLAIITYANEQEDIDRLVEACADIRKGLCSTGKAENNIPEFPELPPQLMTPRQAFFSRTVMVSWQEAVGKISGQMIAPYPPGIPVIYPGERITREVWAYIEKFRQDGRHMHGAAGGQLDRVKVISNSSII